MLWTFHLNQNLQNNLFIILHYWVLIMGSEKLSTMGVQGMVSFVSSLNHLPQSTPAVVDICTDTVQTQDTSGRPGGPCR